MNKINVNTVHLVDGNAKNVIKKTIIANLAEEIELMLQFVFVLLDIMMIIRVNIAKNCEDE